jgi:hypothetical protein
VQQEVSHESTIAQDLGDKNNSDACDELKT